MSECIGLRNNAIGNLARTRNVSPESILHHEPSSTSDPPVPSPDEESVTTTPSVSITRRSSLSKRQSEHDITRSSEENQVEAKPTETCATKEGLNVPERLSVAAEKLLMVVDGLTSTSSKLSHMANDLPLTAATLANTAHELSRTVTLLNSGIESVSNVHESLNTKFQHISDNVDKLNETMDELLKRERMVIEAFGSLDERPGRAHVPFEFQSRGSRRRGQ